MQIKNGTSKTCAKFQQKILNCRIVGARQSFQILRQNTWFLENSRALSKCLHGILHYLISILIKSVHKKQFYFIHATHLKNEKKSSPKDAIHLKIAWHSKRQKKNVEKRERETKSQKKSNNNNKYFFTFTFLYWKIYILLVNTGKT